MINFKAILLAQMTRLYTKLSPIKNKKFFVKYLIIGIVEGGIGKFILHKFLLPIEKTSISSMQILLVGASNTGKTKTFRKIAQKNDTKNFDQLEIASGIQIVDTTSIEFEEDIDLREQTIKEFQTYFQSNMYSIAWFAIFVKYERTDLMKKKLQREYFKLQNKIEKKNLEQIQFTFRIYLVKFLQLNFSKINSIYFNDSSHPTFLLLSKQQTKKRNLFDFLLNFFRISTFYLNKIFFKILRQNY